jgi:hypothetical protein
MKKTTFYLALLFTGILFTTKTLRAQLVQHESFDNQQFLPSGWGTVGTAGNWSRAQALAQPLTGGPHSGTGMARLRLPNGTTAGSISEAMRTPKFDLSTRGTNDAVVSFWMYRDSLMPENVDSLEVFINTDTTLLGALKLGTVARNRSVNLPDTMSANGWYQYSYNIPLSFNDTANYLIFNGTIYGTSLQTSRRIYIDDVNWDEYPAACTGTPNAGFATAADTLICGGGGTTNLTLTDASIGLDVTHQWYASDNINGTYSPIGTNQNDTTGAISSTMYYYNTVTCLTSGLTANSDTITVVVSSNPIPEVSISLENDTICRGDSITLSASGADFYVWTAGQNTSTQQDITLTPLNNILISLIGYDAIGCTSAIISQPIVVGRRPIIQSINSTTPIICESGSSTLTVNAFTGGGGGGTIPLTYTWSENFGDTNSVTVSPTSTTVYTVTVTGQYGCFSVASDSVVVSPNPTASFDWLAAIDANIITFTNTSQNATFYYWDFGDGTNGTEVNPSHDYLGTSAADYQATLIAMNDAGCADSVSKTVHVGGVGIEENKQENKLNVYPNPANSKIYIDLKTDNVSAYTLKMTNLLGERVIQSSIPKGNKGFLKSVDISELPKGVYILEIDSDTKHYTQRVVKN